ncbi:hypothetical protein SprV_0502011900 [Sparganum proliferum]
MGLFGHMRIHESGIDRSLDTSGTPTMPSPAETPPPSAPTATSPTTLSTSYTATMLSPVHTPCLSINQVANVGSPKYRLASKWTD